MAGENIGVKAIIECVANTKGLKDTTAAVNEVNAAIERLGLTVPKIDKIVGGSATFSRVKNPATGRMRTYTDLNLEAVDVGGTRTQVKFGGFGTRNAGIIEAGKDIEVTSKQLKKGEAIWSEYGESIGRAAVRAVYTIPIWMALRTATSAILNTLGEGIKYIQEFDTAMARMGAVVQGVSNKIEFMAKLKTQVTALVAETGKSVTEISEIFYRFAETGMDAETAMAGMNVAAKLSLATFQDTKDVARIMVDLYNNLGQTITDANTPMEKMQEIAGSFVVIWKENAGDLNEYIEALKPLTPVAKEWGLTMKETLATVAVLNTFMQRGSVGGTQLARSLMEITKNVDRVAMALGKTKVEVLNMSPWEKFISLLKTFKDTKMEGTNIYKIMTDIFGERAVKGVSALSGGFDKLIATIDKLDTTTLEQFKKLLEEAATAQTDTIKIQLDRMAQLRNQTVETFVSGIAGANDFLGALKKINDFIENNVIPSLELMNVISSEWKGGAVGVIGRNVGRLASPFSHPLIVSDKFKKTISPYTPASQSSSSMFLQWQKTYASASPEKKFGMLMALKNPDGSNAFTEQEAFDEMTPDIKLQLLANKRVWGSYEGKSTSKVTMKGENANKSQQANIEVQKDYFRLARESIQYELQQTETLTMYGYSQLDIEKAKLEIMIRRKSELGDEKEIQTQILKVQQESTKEIMKYADELDKAMTSLFTNLQGGKLQEGFAGFGDFLTGTFRSTVSEKASSLIMSSGIGEIFGKALSGLKHSGGLIGKIEDAHISGINQGCQNIIQAHRIGLSVGTGTSLGSGISSGLGNYSLFGNNISSRFPVPSSLSSMGSYNIFSNNASYYASKNKTSSPSIFANSGYVDPKTGKMTGASAMGAAINIGMAAYSGYQAGGFGSGAMSAAGAALMMIPTLPTMIAGLMLSIGSGIMANSKNKTDVQEDRKSFQVTSRIDVTNKQLEIVNRNLVALRQEITYILPQSAYFSEKRGIIEDEFSLSSRRGV